MAERGRPGQGQGERGDESHGDRKRQRTEEHPGDAGDRDQGEKDHDRRDGRSNQRLADFPERVADRLAPALAGVAVHDDVLNHDDGIVDDQADSGRQATQGHQVETLAQQPQPDKSDRDGSGNDQPGDQRRAPVAQKEHHDGGGEQQSDQDRVAHAADGCVDDLRLIVERLQRHAGRQRSPQGLDLGVHFLRDYDRVAVRLAVDVQEHGWFAVRGHDGVNRLGGKDHRGDIADAHRQVGRGGLDHDVADLLRRARLPAHQAEDELMVGFDQARRVDQVAAA